MKKLFSFLLALIIISGSGVFAQGEVQENIVISPQSIVVNPLPQFEVDVWVDRDPTGHDYPSYNIGDNITISVKPSEDAYIYLFNVRSTGEITQIIPNYLGGSDNFIRAGQTTRFPRPDAGFTFSVDGPAGLDKVIVVASKSQLNTTDLDGFHTGDNFSSSSIGEESFARSLSIVVTPLPQADWVTDTAIFYVVDNAPAPPPPYGSINVTSHPAGALVYIDGDFRGYTPIEFGESVGRHNLRVELSDYQVFEDTVRVKSGQVLNINFTMERIAKTGTVRFESYPSGAEVFVGGNYVGTTPTGPFDYQGGNYKAIFKLGGYGEATANFNVSYNSEQTVNATLASLQGFLIVRSNIYGARIFVDGQDYGAIPEGKGQGRIDDLSVGKHQLTVVAKGHVTFIEDFTIRPGETTEISVHSSRLHY